MRRWIQPSLFLKQDEPDRFSENPVRSSVVFLHDEPDIANGQGILMAGWTDRECCRIFIAALVENGRATSLGTLTAEREPRQDVIELTNGAAFVLTTGYLVTPRGVQFDRQGLVATYLIEQ